MLRDASEKVKDVTFTFGEYQSLIGVVKLQSKKQPRM